MHRIIHGSTLLLLFGFSTLVAVPIVYPVEITVNTKDTTRYPISATVYTKDSTIEPEDVAVSPIDTMVYPVEENTETNTSNNQEENIDIN